MFSLGASAPPTKWVLSEGEPQGLGVAAMVWF